jgi:hypothetical protein
MPRSRAGDGRAKVRSFYHAECRSLTHGGRQVQPFPVRRAAACSVAVELRAMTNWQHIPALGWGCVGTIALSNLWSAACGRATRPARWHVRGGRCAYFWTPEALSSASRANARNCCWQPRGIERRVNATAVSGASYRPVWHLVRRARQSLLLPAEAATSSRVHRPPAPGHQTIIEALGGKPSLPEPQPLIASLRDLQAVGALSDFSLVRLARQLATLYISPVAPSSSFSQRRPRSQVTYR